MGLFVFFLKKHNFFNSLFRLFKTISFSKKVKILIFLFVFYSFPVLALKIRFPDEELATESVLPIIDPPQMVLNRNVSLGLRAELGIGVSFGMDEPFYFPFYGTGLLAFHLTEAHAISVTGVYFPPLLSSVGKLVRDSKELDPEERFDPQKAPYPQYMAFLNYQYSPYYGKISLAKSWVMNLSIYGFAGPGLLAFQHNNYTVAGNCGIGQKLYFNKWLGIRGDLGFYGYYGPATAKLDFKNLGVENRIFYDRITPQQKRLTINIIANIGVVFLI